MKGADLCNKYVLSYKNKNWRTLLHIKQSSYILNGEESSCL